MAWINLLKSNWPFLLVAFTIGFAGGYKTKSLFVDSAKLTELEEQVKAKDKELKELQDISVEAEKTIAELRKQSRRLNPKVEKIIEKNSTNITCLPGVDGVRIYNEALTGADSR
jgi:uncharacterized coiled-coil protein SlyX